MRRTRDREGRHCLLLITFLLHSYYILNMEKDAIVLYPLNRAISFTRDVPILKPLSRTQVLELQSALETAQDLPQTLVQTLLERMKSVYSNIESLPPDRIVPTVGLNIDRIEAANRKLGFWDLGGQFKELLQGPPPPAVDHEDGNAEACETREDFMIDEE
ncbi:hypothetical protein Ahy_B01g057108 [Arachis hypogaea]|uniref:Uncharacterized protein n=1 Tax=Arachis hypogaea TaxID=3818 RepID=A0A445B0D1_ARAHY|nr:hypothetical protein Ahy_B01g057108 [Arachis hypogaea]